MGNNMSKTKIYHNPRCSKSRQTLELLNNNNIDAEVVEYLNSPPTAEQLEQILTMLELSPRELMRTGEDIYKELNLSDTSLSDAELVSAMVANPRLIERPIVVTESQAKIGRPPESVLTLFNL